MLRHKYNYTLKELGKKFKVSESTMSHYENGKREPDINTLNAMANYFNVSVDFLLGNNKLSDEKQPLSLERLNAACEQANLDPSKIDKLKPEQLDLIVSLVKDMLKHRDNKE